MQVLKQNIRVALRKLNKLTLTEAYRAEAAQAIVRSLVATEMWQKAHRIGLYEALPDEPSLQTLLENPGDKELFIPRVEDAETIAFYPYSPESLQEGGAFGIKEPTQAKEDAVDPTHLDLIVVPGMAFTPEGVRLGRGKAYYDRFLQKAPQTQLIGVTFRYRLLPSLPSDSWDHLMDLVLTN